MCATTRTTIAHHESLTLGAEFVHDTDPRDTKRAVAVHESPVGERIRRAAHANTPRQLPCHQRRNADYPTLGQAPPHRPHGALHIGRAPSSNRRICPCFRHAQPRVDHSRKCL
jgi:hypothetical protein